MGKPVDTAAFGLVFAWMGVTLMRIKGASRDKSIVIFVLFIFSVLFWMAFEQAGNALNLWAEFHTDRKVGSFTYPAAWWQAVNAAGIFILGPVFAWLWMYLHKKGKEPSTPVKMLIAMVMMALSFVAMRVGAQAEDRVITRQAIAAVPDGVDLSKVHARRLTFDASKKELEVKGVLPRYVTNDLLKKTAPKDWAEEVGTLEELTLRATDKAPVTKELTAVPEGFVFPFDAEEAKGLGVTFDQAKKTMTFTAAAKTPTRDTLIAAGAPPSWRDPLWELEKKSQVARVSGIWLFLSYLLATLGELCLSPVGLSMVTKLAPVRFASVFMGVWLLSSSVAQYAGGSIGEQWGIITPTRYFDLFVMTSIVGGVILALLVMPLKRLMHNVR
jgi:POT family proton-dependent oligopeptide transporter